MRSTSVLLAVAALLLSACGTSADPVPTAMATRSESAAPAATATETASQTATATPSVAPTSTATASATSGGAKPSPAAPTTANATPTSTPTMAYDEIQVSNAYVKALDGAMPMNGTFMTGAFMHISNISDQDITLVGGSAAFAGEVQVHETSAGVMRLKAGGLLIKAGTTEILKPGGNHIMFVFMPKRVLAGDEVTFTLLFNDKRAVNVTAAVKQMNAGSESYKPTPAASSSGM